MIPLSQLIMPISPVTPSGGQMGAALGDAGEMMAQQRERDRQFSQKQLEDYQKWLDEAAQRGLQREHYEGVNRYYDAQTALHKDQLTEKQNAEASKRATTLFDAFRKAKTPEERAQIRQQLQGAGFNVTESDTELPEIPAAPEQAPEKMPVSPGGYANPPKANPKFAKDLAAYMASPGAQASTEEPGPSTATSPFPWDLAGFPEPKAPPKPSRGGKFTVTDKQGNQVLSYDEPLVRSQTRQRILDAAAPMVEGARNPENKAAADKAADLAAGALDATGDPKYALDTFMKAYQAEIGQFKKSYREGTGGTRAGPGVPGKQELNRLNIIEQREDALISKHLGAEKAADLVKMEHSLDELEARLKAGGGHNEVLAQVADVKAANGRAAAQQEFKAIQGATGAAANLETLMNHYLTPDGHISEETVRQMLAGVQQLRAAARNDRERIAAAIEQDFNTSMIPQMMTPEEIEKGRRRVRGAASGNYGESKPPEGTKAPAGGASGEERAKKWLREHGGG